MRYLVVLIALIVAVAALGLSVYVMQEEASDGSGLAGIESRVELLRTRLSDLEKKLAKADATVAGLNERVNELDELSRGLISISEKVPTEDKLKAEIDGVLEEKLKKVKWTPQTKVKFDPKSDKDKQFAELHGAVEKAVGLKGEESDALLALMLEQREKLNEVYREATRRKADRATRDRQLSDVKREFDAVLKWKFTGDQFTRYTNWRRGVTDRYMKAFLVP